MAYYYFFLIYLGLTLCCFAAVFVAFHLSNIVFLELKFIVHFNAIIIRKINEVIKIRGVWTPTDHLVHVY